MRQRYRRLKDEAVRRATGAFIDAVQASMNPAKAAADAEAIRLKYRGLPVDAVANLLIRRAARKTKWEGAANGLVVSGCEVVVAVPDPEPIHKGAAAAAALAALVGDLAWTTRVQMQLILSLAHLYGAAFDPDDDEDAYAVFLSALGLKGIERAGVYSRFVVFETARKQFRRLLRTGGIRAAVQKFIVKVAGPKVGKLLAEKYVLRLIVGVNIVLGYGLNNAITKSVGRWGKIKAKIRAAAFRQSAVVLDVDRTAAVWILPLIYYAGTAAGHLRDNLLTLYSQVQKRLLLTENQSAEIEAMIDDEQLATRFADFLSTIASDRVRTALYDIALTAAAVNLDTSEPYQLCLRDIAGWLKIQHADTALQQRIEFLKR